MDNQTRRILLERVKASGFPGSILDVFQNPAILDQFIAEQQQSQLQSQQQFQQQSQPVVAQTPQEQEQGLRPAHAAGNVGQSMIFPNVEPNQSFNTVGMKIPIDINKVDNQGNLVESYKAVPPGIQDLPTGPNRGMVIESPAEGYAKTGGVRKYQTGSFDIERIMADMQYPGYTAPTVDIVGYKSDKQKEKEFKDWEKSVRSKPLPSGAITPTLSPIDAAVGIAAGIPGLMYKGLQTGIPALASTLNTPVVVGSTTLPGVTMGNILGAAGAAHSTQQILDPSSELRTNPNAENALMTGLGFVGLPYKSAGLSLADDLGQVGKYLTTQTPLKNVPKPKTLPGSGNGAPVVNTARNLEDLNAAQKFAQQYGYELPQNLERIAQSDELTNRTIRGMMDRHNTFVRGVSTNWEELGKRNPEILRHLEGKGFDLSTKEGTKAAAEYMATHIPIETGYGRASLNTEVFDRGLQGLYTSNSIRTAEGYTYGQGFVVKAKKPTNFSSVNRQDWITQNNPYYRDEDKFRELLYPLSDETKYAIYSSKSKSWNPKSYDEKLLKNASPKQKAIKEVEYRIEQLKKDIAEIEPNKDKWLDAKEVLYSKKEAIKQMENDIKYLEQHGDEILKTPEEFKILRTERSNLPTDPYNFLIEKEGNAKKMSEWLKTQPYQQKMREVDDLGESLKKYTWEEQQPIRDKIDILTKEANEMYNKSLQDYMKLNHPDYDPINKYAHYIHLGTPGEKILQPIKSWEITPEIWKNKSRAHTNKYSKKFSALSLGGFIRAAASQKQQQKTGGVKTYLKGGLKNRVLYNKAKYKR